MLPMLPLDGGHVAIAAYRWIRTRKGQPYYRADITKLFPGGGALHRPLLALVYACPPASTSTSPIRSTSRTDRRGALVLAPAPVPSAPPAAASRWAGVPHRRQRADPRCEVDDDHGEDGRRRHIAQMRAGGGRGGHRALHLQRGGGRRRPSAHRPSLPGADHRRHPFPPPDGTGRARGRRAGPAPGSQQPAQGGRDQPGGRRSAATGACPSASGVNARVRCTRTSTRSTAAPRPKALVESARNELAFFEEVDFTDMKISVKARPRSR